MDLFETYIKELREKEEKARFQSFLLVDEHLVVISVTVIPDKPMGANLTVTVYRERDGLEQAETVTLYVAEEGGVAPDGGDEMGSLAAEIRDEFIPWLAENHPEFGITSETERTGTIVRPHFMVVMFYLFFSEDWEMGVSWHVMIPPHDWKTTFTTTKACFLAYLSFNRFRYSTHKAPSLINNLSSCVSLASSLYNVHHLAPSRFSSCPFMMFKDKSVRLLNECNIKSFED